jgi:hypothetical protein
MNRFRSAVSAGALLAALLSCSCASLGLPGVTLDGDPAENQHKEPPTVKSIAGDIDCLEKHLDKYGSIVPKHVDVWGQARLMMYRQEFERVMRQDAYTFSPTLQATIARSDQAFLANALSI